MRNWLKLIGLNKNEFSFRCNIEAEMIKSLGDWASDAYQRYIDISFDKCIEAMQLFMDGINIII